MAQYFEPHLELQQNHSDNATGINNVNQHTNFVNHENPQNHFTLPSGQDNKIVQDNFMEHESTHNATEASSYNNFVPHHSRNGSSSTASSQIIHENTDQDTISHHSSAQPVENYNFNSNTPDSASHSLQKEHLLQMANAVANVLEPKQNFDEPSLNNSDLEQRNQFLTCCLEEQKKVVSQLHIQVSQSVSHG